MRLATNAAGVTPSVRASDLSRAASSRGKRVVSACVSGLFWFMEGSVGHVPLSRLGSGICDRRSRF